MKIVVERDKVTGVYITVLGVVLAIIIAVVYKTVEDVDMFDIISMLVIATLLVLYGIWSMLQPKQAIIIKENVMFIRKAFSNRIVDIKKVQCVSIVEKRLFNASMLNVNRLYRQKNDINSVSILYTEAGIIKQIKVSGIRNSSTVVQKINILIENIKQG